MKPEESRQLKEKRAQLFSHLKLLNIFPGEWDSIYKGEGTEFVDTKPLEPGDDPRRIDLRALVGRGERRVVQRVETRQLRVYICADYSGSLQYFEQMLFPRKSWIRDIAVGLILYSAVKMYSPISFYPFGLAKNKFFPPRMGEGYCQEILDWIADEENLRPYVSSGVESVLTDLTRLAQPRNIVFFVSDFKQKIFDTDFTNLLKKTVSKFDFIPVVIRDPLEKNVKLCFSTRIKVRGSGEKNKAEEIYLTPDTLQKMQEVSQEHLFRLGKNFKKLNIEHLVLDSASVEDCCRAFSNFFQARKKISR